MLSLRRGCVSAVAERLEGLVRLEVDGAPCIAYPRLTGPVALGDDVVVNVQARELGLGSGGFDILYLNLTRGLGLEPEPGAHVMKLPYTPLQAAWLHGEERGAGPGLAGTPVVCCSLHSQVAPVCGGIGDGVRVAYVQLGGGALPVTFSDAVRGLKCRGLIDLTVAAAPCLDADVECVGVASALAWLGEPDRGVDVVVCAIGPGVVGTGSAIGHGGVAAAEAANAASALGGRPIIAVRASSGDPRARHRGVSHHTRDALRLALGDVRVAWPEGGADAPSWLEPREEVAVDGWEEACAGLPLSHMGRSPADDPVFFSAAFAAGRLARSLL